MTFQWLGVARRGSLWLYCDFQWLGVARSGSEWLFQKGPEKQQWRTFFSPRSGSTVASVARQWLDSGSNAAFSGFSGCVMCFWEISSSRTINTTNKKNTHNPSPTDHEMQRQRRATRARAHRPWHVPCLSSRSRQANRPSVPQTPRPALCLAHVTECPWSTVCCVCGLCVVLLFCSSLTRVT